MLPAPVIERGEVESFAIIEIVTRSYEAVGDTPVAFLPPPQEISRRTIQIQRIPVTTTRYEQVENDEQPPPAPGETVALLDWSAIKINDPSETDAARQIVSANDTTSSHLPDGPVNTEHCYTKIVQVAGRSVIEFGVNHGVIQRPEGTAARLFFAQWGFLAKYLNRLMTCEFELMFPDEFITAQGAGVGLSAGVQNKNPEFCYCTTLMRYSKTEPLRMGMFHKTSGKFTQIAPVELPFGAWIPMRYESWLAEDNTGWLNVYVDGKHAFRLEGFKSQLAGFGGTLYDVHAVNKPIRMYLSTMRIDIQ